ncbi:hypothetical protein FRB91_009078 [Serendipita sp. 411]|nr:hypothetical protein FRB91_009078 [Serendipita sp. 411]
MTAAPATSTALPPGVVIPHNENTNNQGNQAPIPVPQPDWPAIPKLLLSIEDMACPGAVRFMNLQDSPAFLQSCVVTIFELLFTSKSAPRNVRSIKLILRPMDGVAYTTGSRLDNDHKEIHFNTNYIAVISPERIVSEIKGVILHELVHCFQCSGQGCPGGLIEGMADYVRLRGGFVPPHWKRSSDGKWDSGYERTGYFLDWVDTKYGSGTIRKLNESMEEEYHEAIWETLTGHSVDHLWKTYCKDVDVWGKE